MTVSFANFFLLIFGHFFALCWKWKVEGRMKSEVSKIPRQEVSYTTDDIVALKAWQCMTVLDGRIHS